MFSLDKRKISGRWRKPFVFRSRSAPQSIADVRDPAMPVYREVAYRFFSFAMTLLMLPLGIWNLLNARWMLGTIECVLLLPLLFHCWSYARREKPWLSPSVLLGMTLLALCLSLYFGREVNVYWAPVMVVAFHYILDRRTALLYNLLLLGAVTPVALQTLPEAHGSIFLMSLAFSSTTAFLFSEAVSRQDRLLERAAVLDPLTQAYNRRYMMENLERTIELNRRYQKPSSLIMLDIDHFKMINDQLGHSEGDRTLKEVVRLLHQRLRRTDVLFRYGGEEFVILLSETEALVAGHLAGEFCRLIREARILPRRSVTISCGVAEIAGEETALAWLGRCDEALYRAKNEGRNQAQLAA